jgi:hypothetical protein
MKEISSKKEEAEHALRAFVREPSSRSILVPNGASRSLQAGGPVWGA